jgi:hypothetical protein
MTYDIWPMAHGPWPMTHGRAASSLLVLPGVVTSPEQSTSHSNHVSCTLCFCVLLLLPLHSLDNSSAAMAATTTTSTSISIVVLNGTVRMVANVSCRQAVRQSDSQADRQQHCVYCTVPYCVALSCDLLHLSCGLQAAGCRL